MLESEIEDCSILNDQTTLAGFLNPKMSGNKILQLKSIINFLLSCYVLKPNKRYNEISKKRINKRPRRNER